MNEEHCDGCGLLLGSLRYRGPEDVLCPACATLVQLKMHPKYQVETCPDCGCPGEEYDGHVCEDYLHGRSSPM